MTRRWTFCTQSSSYCILLVLFLKSIQSATISHLPKPRSLPDDDTTTDSLVAAAQKSIDDLIESDKTNYLHKKTPTMIAIINNSTFNLRYSNNLRTHYDSTIHSIPSVVHNFTVGIVAGYSNDINIGNFGADFSFSMDYDHNQVDHSSYQWENSGYLTFAVENTPLDKIPTARDGTKINVCPEDIMSQWCHGSVINDKCWENRKYKIADTKSGKPSECFWPGEFKVNWHHGTYITKIEGSEGVEDEVKIPIYFVVLNNEKTKYGFQKRRVSDLSWNLKNEIAPKIESFTLESTRYQDSDNDDWSGVFHYDHHIYAQKWGCENGIYNCYNDVGTSDMEYPIYVSNKAVIFYMGNAFSLRQGAYQEGHMIEQWAMTDIRHYDRVVQYSLMQICLVRAGWCGAFGGQPILYSFTGLDGFYGNDRATKEEELFSYEYTTCAQCGWSSEGYGFPQYRMTNLVLGKD